MCRLKVELHASETKIVLCVKLSYFPIVREAIINRMPHSWLLFVVVSIYVFHALGRQSVTFLSLALKVSTTQLFFNCCFNNPIDISQDCKENT